MGIIIIEAKVVVQFRIDGFERDTWSTARRHFVPKLGQEPGIKEHLDAWSSVSIEYDDTLDEPTRHPREILAEQLVLVNGIRFGKHPELEFGPMIGGCIRVGGVHYCTFGYRLRMKGAGDLTYEDPTTRRSVSVDMALSWESQGSHH